MNASLPTVGDYLDELDRERGGVPAGSARPADTAHLRHHWDLVQGTDEWLAARRGLLTASEVKLILTPTLKVAANEKTRAHVYEIAAQRITGHVEPSYVGDDMLRGHDEEYLARQLYAEKVAPVLDCGFITNREFGFTIGCSPDGLVAEDGMIESKSRRQKFQVETISTGTVPPEHMLQLQASLLVTGRKWIDFLSYSNGMPMVAIRIERNTEIMEAIYEAALGFEEKVAAVIADYRAALSGLRTFPTERRQIQEMF
jgi:predicted phage-related endonuclease